LAKVVRRSIRLVPVWYPMKGPVPLTISTAKIKNNITYI
jgi:hypothetical protein